MEQGVKYYNMLPLNVLLYLMVGLSLVVADERIGEIAEDSTYYRSSQNPDRSQLPRVIQPVHRIPRPMPRPIFVATIEPEPVPTVTEVTYPVSSSTPTPVGGNQLYGRPNFLFVRPSVGSRPVTSSPSVPSPENPLNRPSSYIPNRFQQGWPARQPVYPTASIPTNVVDQAPIEEQNVVSGSWSSSLSHRPIFSVRPIPQHNNAGVIESTPAVTEPVSIPETDTSEVITENIVEEQKDVVITPRPVSTIPAVIPSDSKPYNQRPFLSARPIPRPFSYGIVTPKIESPPVTEPSTQPAIAYEPKPTEVTISTSLLEEPEIDPEILTIPKSPAIIAPATPEYVTLPAIPTVWRPYQRPIISARPIPRPTTEVVILPSSDPEPVEPLPNSTESPIPEFIPEPVITEQVLSSTAFPDVWISPEHEVTIPHHIMPSPPPRPNVEYWRPNLNQSVPAQPLTVEEPSIGRYPTAQVQPNNNIVSNVVSAEHQVTIPHHIMPTPPPRPNVEYWKPNPTPSVPAQPLPVEKPLVPSSGRYPAAQEQPNNNIVSNVFLPEQQVTIPHPVMPSPGPVSRPRPNVEYWKPNPTPSVPAQPLPVEKPLVPSSGRYPTAQEQPNNNIVSNVFLPEQQVTIPHPVMPSPGPVSRPRPNIEYWRPNPTPSVPAQPLPVEGPLVPSLGRYPTAQEQPNNNIVSNVVPESKPMLVTNRPTSKPIVGPKPIPNTSPTFSVIAGKVLDMRCESENGYFARQECDSYVECKRNVATEYLCPDGLHFNPNTVWPEYPCTYPSEVQCVGKPVYQPANPTSECPRQYGFFPMGGDCSKYLMCQEGVATIMSCPPGLVYNPAISGCDWPEQVPSCKPEIFQGFTCPPVPSDEDPDIMVNYKYGNSCKNYVACQRGSPRFLSCDDGFSFDMNSGYCIESDYVENCTSFV